MIKRCKQCNSINYYAKGLCKSCYKKALKPKHWSRKFDACINCGRNDIPHQAKGLCDVCYRNRKSNILCACGCGEFTTIHGTKPRKFIRGHWLKTQPQTAEFWVKSRQSVQGENNPCYGKFGKDHPAFEHYTTDETRKLRREMRIKQLAKRKTAPTDIEIILAEILDELKIKHFPQHPINEKFVVDEFIPNNVIIEAFGDYWHGNPEKFHKNELSDLQIKNIKKDKSRTKYLKTCGYRLLILWEKDLKFRRKWCKSAIKDFILPNL